MDSNTEYDNGQSLINTERSTNEPAAEIEASLLLKLKCFIYTLLIIALGFVVAVIETQTFFAVNGKENNATREYIEKIVKPLNIACYVVKCVNLAAAIAALLYLQSCVIVKGKVSQIELQPLDLRSHSLADSPEIAPVVVRNVWRYVQLPGRLSSSPPLPFIAMSLLFAIFSCLSIVLEIACGGQLCIQEIIRRLLLLGFIVIQTRFFLLHHRISIHWKLKQAYFCSAHIMAANIAAWFINVGFELREVIGASEEEHKERVEDYCESKSVDAFIRALYPFLIESYVMSALLAFAFMVNLGKTAAEMRNLLTHKDLTTESIRTKLCNNGSSIGQNWQTESQMLRRFSKTIGLGLCSVLMALSVAVILKAYGKEAVASEITFYCAMIILYLCGFVCNWLLMRMLNTDKAPSEFSGIHHTDRALLWLGTIAIAVNDMYTFAMSLTKILQDNSRSDLIASDTLRAFCSAINIFQSLLQVVTLECTLVCKLSPDNSQYGRALLTVLMLLNAAQWLLNTICFNFFFPKNQMDDALALTLLTMPLQVFFRFHSIACIYEFKEHCDATDEQPDEAAGSIIREQIDFPNDIPGNDDDH